MNQPPTDRTDSRDDFLSSHVSPEQVPAHDVLFEMGMIVAAHLAVALSVVLTLRVFGLLGS
jgi:hypothetical protein